MSVNLIFKIAAVGILVSVICQVLKHSGREEQAFLTSLAGLVLVLFWILPYLFELFDTMKQLFALYISVSGGHGMIQAVMIGITGVFLALFLKQTKPEYAVCISVGTGLLLLLLAAGRLSLVVENIRLIQDAISVQSAYIQVLLKIIGITYISEFAADICRDAGCSAVAGQIGVFAKLSILAVSMPIVSALLQTVQNFLGG